MQQLWLVTVPNNNDSPEKTCETLRLNVPNCRFHRFQIPNLVVGTLDSLLVLSDDLIKVNGQVENVVRKVERQYLEIAGTTSESLRVNSTTVESYLRKFEWDFARYQYSGRSLADLVSQIQANANKVDEELKKLASNLTDKNLQLSTLQRKKVINLYSSDFEDFLTPEQVARLEILRADTIEKVLETVMIVFSKSLDAEFLRSYESIGKDIVLFEDGKGTPIVPGSHKKVFEDNENVIYSIVILTNHYQKGSYEGETFIAGKTSSFFEPLKVAMREKKFTLREFTYDGNKSNSIDRQIEVAKQQVDQTRTSIIRWCQTHYGEVYSGWVHLKVIRCFVESVLRYGLPVNFVSMFVEPNMQKERQIKASLLTTVSQLRPELVSKKLEIDEEEQETDESENLPFVCQKFNVIGASSEVK